jgi:hypothetical protein
MQMEIYVVCLQGVPTITFSDYGNLLEYLEAQGTNPDKVKEDMEYCGTPDWEWYKLACDGPDYKAAFSKLMEYWDSFSKDQKEDLNKELKAIGC